jgi:hypothetical protein
MREDAGWFSPQVKYVGRFSSEDIPEDMVEGREDFKVSLPDMLHNE